MSETCNAGDLNYPDCDKPADADITLPFHALATIVGGRPRTQMRLCAEHATEMHSRFPDAVVSLDSSE